MKRHNHVSGPVVLRDRTTRKTQHSFTYPTEGAILRVSVQKNKKLRGKFKNFKIAQTLAISGPY